MFDSNESAKLNSSHHWNFKSLKIGMNELFKNQNLPVFNLWNQLSEAGNQINAVFM